MRTTSIKSSLYKSKKEILPSFISIALQFQLHQNICLFIFSEHENMLIVLPLASQFWGLQTFPDLLWKLSLR